MIVIRFFSGVFLALLVACAANEPAAPQGLVEEAKGEPTVVEPVTSPADAYDYRYVTLDNGLRALLISDPTSPMAAASLDVMVGSGENPIDRGGLAHFLEHMLFMGTEKYPDVDEYERYLSENGGGYNAYTSFEHTNYFFDVKADALEGALDRFAQFFVAPLLDPDYVAREKNAVHAEYKMGLNSDGRRTLDVLRELAHEGHPYSRFTVGNLDSLADAEGRDIRADLQAFYAKYYSAPAMRLVVLGPQSLDELQALVTPRFVAIPDNGNPVEPVQAPLFAPGTLPMVLTIEPVATQRELQLIFPMGDYRADYRTKPLNYIGNVIGHEGEGSLLAYLKRAGLAESVGAGGGLDWRGGSLFSITVRLSAEGAERWEDVAAAVYAYLDLLRDAGPEAWRFREQGDLAAVNFRFREEIQPQGYVAQLANAMQYYAPADVLAGPYLMDDYRPELLAEAIDQLRPDNALLIYSAPGVSTDTRSQYYDVGYTAAAPTPVQQAKWSGAAAAGLSLPAANPFIAKSFDLVERNPDWTAQPVEIVDDPRLSLWVRQDDRFEVPKGRLYVQFMGGDVAGSPEREAVAALYTALVNDAVNELGYPALLAGLGYSINAGPEGIQLRLSGFNDRQPTFLGALRPYFALDDIDPTRFENLRQEAIRQLENVVTQRPYSRSLQDLNEALLTGLWNEAQRIAALRSVTPEQVREFGRQFWSQASAEVLMYGNYSEAAVEAMSAELRGFMGDAPVAAREEQQVVRLEPGERLRLVAPLEHNDAVVLHYAQVPSTSIRDRAATALTAETSKQGFFNDLRTERQMGYVAFSANYPRKRVPGWLLLVQSPSHSAAEVAAAMDAFRHTHLDTLDAAAFERYKEALLTELRKPSKNLSEEGGRQWSELGLGETTFDTYERIAAEVEAMEFTAWRDYYRAHFLNDGAWFEVIAPGTMGVLPESEAVDVGDATGFRAGRL